MKIQNKIRYIVFLVAILVGSLCSNTIYAQDEPQQIDVSKMTREEVLNIPYDQLVEMPLDQLLLLADIVGVSLDELYEMILNKDVTSASKKVESSFDSPYHPQCFRLKILINQEQRLLRKHYD